MHFALATIYSGVEFRSRCEADAAYLFDNLGLLWRYRPKCYALGNGEHYTPDFYLPEIGLWVECMHRLDRRIVRQIEGFSTLIKEGGLDRRMQPRPERRQEDVGDDCPDYLLIGPDGSALLEYERRPLSRLPYAKGAFISEATVLQCAKCRRWYFLGFSGASFCRHCGHDDYAAARGESALSIPGGRLAVNSRSVKDWAEDDLSRLADNPSA